MRVCVVGAGSIGGLLAAKLEASGEDVTVIARGPHLAAIKQNGLRLIEAEGEIVAKVDATSALADVGNQDLIVLAVKAHQIADVAPQIGKVLASGTTVLTAQNGIPWWYFLKGVGIHQGRQLQSVDPGGLIASHIPVASLVGSVVYAAADIVAPGVIRHAEGNRVTVGEVDGVDTPRIRAISEALANAGFKSPISSDIRLEIWTKLLGNLTFNPISALTHVTLAGICHYPLTRELAARMMEEAKMVGEKLGTRVRISIDKRIAGATAIGEHKTSMLQDVEAGRVLEIDALLGSVIELARLTDTPTPHLDTVYGLTKLLAERLKETGTGLKLAGERI
ncbi:MAG: 2-dehydropantoate 2-reductase [Hyphomicrobiales bacterium]